MIFFSTSKRKKKINVPQSAISKRLTRVIQSQTVKHADLERLQYDLSNEPVNGYSRLDSIGRQIEEWNTYCAAKEFEENNSRSHVNDSDSSSSDSQSSPSDPE